MARVPGTVLEIFPLECRFQCPPKNLENFESRGKKKVHRSSGIRTHDHCSTSPGPSPLSHPARRCWLPFFAKFIHLKPKILTLVNNRLPKPKPLELVNNRSPKPKPLVNNRLPKPNPPLLVSLAVYRSVIVCSILLLATYRSRELCRLFKPYIWVPVPAL